MRLVPATEFHVFQPTSADPQGVACGSSPSSISKNSNSHRAHIHCFKELSGKGRRAAAKSSEDLMYYGLRWNPIYVRVATYMAKTKTKTIHCLLSLYQCAAFSGL